MYFQYGSTEVNYLKSTDKRLAYVIDKIGHINRTLDDDLFSSIVHHIIAQQISAKAEVTIWGRLHDLCGDINPSNIHRLNWQDFRNVGIGNRNSEYIKLVAHKIIEGEYYLKSIPEMEDEESIRRLTEIKGIGRWTAEMILLFCLQRKNILSFDDHGIRRVMSMTFQLETINRSTFEKYRMKFSPYNSIVSLYFWEVNAGAIPELSSTCL